MSDTFAVNVDGVGTFTFRRRNLRDQFRIGAEKARLTEGVKPIPEDLEISATAVSTLNVLTVEAPEGWNVEEMDPLDEQTYDKILKVFGALRAREDSFRGRSAPKGEEAGEGEGAKS
jgi:hypothetical protein